MPVENDYFDSGNILPEKPETVHSSLSRAQRLYRGIGKRAFDISLVVILVLPVLPLLIVLTLLVWLQGGTPIYSHARVGRNGRVFGCLKFRSMVPDADARLADLLAMDPEAAEEWDKTQKLIDDPRVTRLGRFLRKSSLDELPQLWNVLKGDMSLVGPRPVMAEELVRYGDQAATYLLVRPGVTGVWQVTGRNSTTYPERVAMDVDYVQHHGLMRDIGLILRTFATVIFSTGV